MATLAEQLAYHYALNKRLQPGLRKGQFMQQLFPGKYKNEQSAYQGYNQVVSGKRKRGGQYLEPRLVVRRTAKLRGKEVPLGGYEQGLWKVIIHYHATDSKGAYGPREGSFNAHSEEHTTLLSVPYIRQLVMPLVYERLEEWSQSMQDIELDYVEVIPINHINREAVELDEIWIPQGNFSPDRYGAEDYGYGDYE